MTASAAGAVRQFFEAMQARDWDAAATALHPHVHVWWPATDERFTGEAFLEMQRAYPEGWSIEVVEVLADGDGAAARVAVDSGGVRHWCHGTYRLEEGRIRRAVELWAAEGSAQPPPWRARFTS